MSLTFEHLDAIEVLDAVIADMRASGDTGHVENLLQARASFVELIDAAEAAVSTGAEWALDALTDALARVWGTP